MDEECKDCEAVRRGLGSLITRHKFLMLAASGITLAVLEPPDVLAKKKCKYGTMTVVRKVHGKKKKVKICRPAPKTPTATPTATAIPQVAVAEDQTSIYAGPGNLDFPILGTLPAGTLVQPTGIFGDFVAIASQQGSQSLTGYVAVSSLASRPQTPELTIDTVPWALVGSLGPVTPVVWYNPASTFGGERLFGFSVPPGEDILLTMSLTVSGPSDAKDPYTGIVIDNDLLGQPEERRISLLSNQGAWSLAYHDGSAFEFFDAVPALGHADTVALSLRLTGDGAQITLEPTGSSPMTRTLQTPLFRGDTGARVETQLAPGFSLSATQLSLTRAPSGTYETPSTGTVPLRDAANATGMHFGANPLSPYVTYDFRQRALLAREFDLLISSGFFWTVLHPEQHRFDFAHADLDVTFALEHGLGIYITPLAWNTDNPDWLEHGSWSSDTLLGALHDHIEAISTRYGDAFRTLRSRKLPVIINVTLEALLAAPGFAGYSDGVWTRVIGGSDYIQAAFEYAYAAFPDASLTYVDYDILGPGPKTDLVLSTLKDLRSHGIPVDIGLEAYIDAAHPPNMGDLTATLQRFAALGSQVIIDEMDVYLNNLTGPPSDQLATQAQLYTDFATACLASGVCKSISTWGVGDQEPLWPPGAKQAVLFDEQYAPKPAYFAVKDALVAHKGR